MIFYHGTAALYADKIKREGLIPRKGKGADAYALHSLGEDGKILAQASLLYSDRRGVYITPDPETADWFARMAAAVNESKPLVLKLDLPDTREVREKLIVDRAAGNLIPGDIYHDTIPPIWIKGEVHDIKYRFGKPVPIGGGYERLAAEL